MLTAERLRSLLHYDRETGRFTRLVRTAQSVRVGDEAGTVARNGYVYVSVDGRRYLAQRLAVLHVTGEWPKGDVDHINGTKNDNRWSNLRDVTRSVNMLNVRAARASNRSTGLLGAYRVGSRFFAAMMVDGKSRYLGRFDTAELAHRAYIDAKQRLAAQ